MENVVEIVQTEIQSEVQLELLNQEPFGHCSTAEQNEIEIFEENKVEELNSDEEINLQYASSLDSETDGSSEKPQQFALTLHKSVPVGKKHIERPSTAKTSKFVNKNKSTKLGFGYRPKTELTVEQEPPASDNDISEQDSDVSHESVENDAPATKRRKISLTTVPQRRSSRVANLKMSQSMAQRGRSKSMTKVVKSASKSMPAKKGRATSRKRTRSNARSRSRSRSKSTRSRARKSSKATKSAPMKRRATKRRRRTSKK
ncbi:unnamed protein product [Diamesa tonsa]